MNIFVLCTGRCGSTTFVEACRHITNYSAAHESRKRLLGRERVNYPPNHIEADNRLTWFLGRLEKAYGDSGIYVHLRRSDLETAQSFVKRWKYKFGIIGAYSSGVLGGPSPEDSLLDVCLDYCDTVNSNIEAFLANKTKKMVFSLENAKEDFAKFWDLIGAEGDFAAALSEWSKDYHSSRLKELEQQKAKRPFILRALHKLVRITKKFPAFIKAA